GENPAGAVPTAQHSASSRLLRWNGAAARDLRPAGVHALLGAVVAGGLGGGTGEHAEPGRTSAPGDRSAGSRLSAPLHRSAAPGSESKAVRPLRLLRNHGQLRSVAAVPRRGAPALAALAVSSLRRLQHHGLGLLCARAAGLPPAAGSGGPLGVPLAVNPCSD